MTLYLHPRFDKYDLVAQLVEQYTFNVWVLGSKPSQVTKKVKHTRLTFFYRPDAGIGRQAWLRAMCSLERVGSSPTSGTFQNATIRSGNCVFFSPPLFKKI